MANGPLGNNNSEFDTKIVVKYVSFLKGVISHNSFGNLAISITSYNNIIGIYSRISTRLDEPYN